MEAWKGQNHASTFGRVQAGRGVCRHLWALGTANEFAPSPSPHIF